MRFLPQISRASLNDFDITLLRKALSNISFGQKTNNTDNGQNIVGQWITGTSPSAANTEFAVAVNLGYIPVGFDVKRQNAAASFYDSGTAWTESNIYLKCSVASVVYTLFVH